MPPANAAANTPSATTPLPTPPESIQQYVDDLFQDQVQLAKTQQQIEEVEAHINRIKTDYAKHLDTIHKQHQSLVDNKLMLQINISLNQEQMALLQAEWDHYESITNTGNKAAAFAITEPPDMVTEIPNPQSEIHIDSEANSVPHTPRTTNNIRTNQELRKKKYREFHERFPGGIHNHQSLKITLTSKKTPQSIHTPSSNLQTATSKRKKNTITQGPTKPTT
jgi:small-conductance mechanosensitive channel